MRLIKPVNLEDASWMDPITNDFYAELKAERFDAGRSLFETEDGLSDINDRYLSRRKEALRGLVGNSRTLEPGELKDHVQLFIKSLTALFPALTIEDVTDLSGLGDYNHLKDLEKVINEGKDGVSFKRGYELL
jgi:hypothetical protein